MRVASGVLPCTDYPPLGSASEWYCTWCIVVSRTYGGRLKRNQMSNARNRHKIQNLANNLSTKKGANPIDSGGSSLGRGFADSQLTLRSKHHTDSKTLSNRPFHGAEACVLGLRNEKRLERIILKDKRQKIESDMEWDTVKELVLREDVQSLPPPHRSFYHKLPRRGADIYPKVLITIDPNNPMKTRQPKRAKAPWKSL